MNKILLRLALPAACLLCAQAHAAEKPLAVIPLKPLYGVPTVQARIGGQEGVFLFDTGGGVSAITPEVAAAVGCKPWGRITGFRMSGQRLDMSRCDELDLELGGQALHTPIAGVFNLMALLPSDAPRLSGILALDVLAGRTISIDEAAGTLTIESPASFRERIAGAKEVPIRLVRDAGGVALGVELAVTTPSGTAWMEVDTGSDGSFIIGQHLAALFNLDPDKKGGKTLSLQIPGGVQLQAPGMAKDLIMDGNIGSLVWKRWVLTIDLAAGRMWMAPAVEQKAGA